MGPAMLIAIDLCVLHRQLIAGISRVCNQMEGWQKLDRYTHTMAQEEGGKPLSKLLTIPLLTPYFFLSYLEYKKSPVTQCCFFYRDIYLYCRTNAAIVPENALNSHLVRCFHNLS